MTADHSQRIHPVIEEIETVPASEEKAKEVIKELDQLNHKNDLSNSSPKTNYKLIILITLLTALVVGFVSGGVYVYFSGVSSLGQIAQNHTQPTPITPIPTVVPTTSPSPKPDEKIDVSSYKVSVLNGSGRIGEASKVADLLKPVGFKIINTGNASRYDYQETLIQTTDKVPQNVIELVVSTLSEDYQTKLGDPLKTPSPYDIIITVGSK